MDLEYFLNITTVLSLIIGGLIIVYQGINYIQLQKSDDQKRLVKLFVVGVLTIILGALSILFGVLHYLFWMEK